MKINKIKNRIFALILCITVCMSLVPQYVRADDSVSDTVMIEETSAAQEQSGITDDTVSTEDTQIAEEPTVAEEPAQVEETSAAEETTAAEEPTTAEETTAVEETAPAEEPTAAEVTAAAETDNTSQQAVQPQTGAYETPAVSGVASILSKTVRTSDNYRYKITVSYDASAGIPADAKLSVKEITAKTIGVNEDDIRDYINQSAEALKISLEEMSSVRLFDISLIGTDGTEYQPDEKVAVSIELLGKDNETEDMRVVHFGDKPEELTAEVESNTVTFETEGFSLFSLVDITVLDRVIDAALGENSKLYENDDIILTGKMPAHGIVEANPVNVNIDGAEVLIAYDIKIYASPILKALGIAWQPTEGAIQVTVKSDALAGKTDSLKVYHMADATAQAELVAEAQPADSSVTFDAFGFSVYVVVDHEGEEVVAPRVQFHFIANGASEMTDDSSVYYIGEPYSFKVNKNKNDEYQNSQIIADGESLELITDPENQGDNYFYGWYVVDPFVKDEATDGISTDGKLYFTWPASPNAITFESPISIEESNINIGDTVHWELDGVSGSGAVDADGNVHVFLAPVFNNYNFVNFMLYAKNVTTAGAKNVMTRKLVANGSSLQTSVKISDIRSTSTDPVHLIFTGWEYNAGTEENPNWIQTQTVDYSGAEINAAGGGVYLNLDHLADRSSVDLYPIFVEARWVDFFTGVSGSGATYVSSRFRESWGTATPEGTAEDPEKNIFTQFDTSSRNGYSFEGWYAFAAIDSATGAITNLEEPADVTVNYIDSNDIVQSVTVNTTAIKIADRNGNVVFNGTCYLTDNGDGTGTISTSGSGQILLSGSGDTPGRLKLYDALDRMSLSANWTSGDTQITVVYWTENAQDKDYIAPADPKDDYTASAVKVISTAQLNEQSSTIGATFSSGAQITLAHLQEYNDGSVKILNRTYLDDIGAVLAGEEKFYDLNAELSDNSVVIKGDGSSTFNVYFNRKTFKIVFHIGRDGYVKSNGQQKTTDGWDPYGNWIQYMFKDSKLTQVLGHEGTGASYAGVFKMTYNGVTYTSEYETNTENIMGDYVPGDDENVYVITAKYGAYIGDRWPTPTNPNFTFEDPPGANRTMYIWAAYYGSLYCRIANERPTYGNQMGNNPDINGIYEYMSAELCSNRAGDDIINYKQVHHLVAYFGDKGKPGIIKNYHVFYEAIDGIDIPDGAVLVNGNDYLGYNQTSWSAAEGSADAIDGNQFYQVSVSEVISNLEPEYQLASNRDGYELVYSCHNTPQTNEHHIYFFYRPKQYTLTFNMGNTTVSDHYYYTESLAGADKYTDQIVVPEGYYFKGWYTNSSGIGDPFDFASEKMPSHNEVLYPVLSVLQYTVKLDPNGGVIDHRANPSMATYFTADYGTPVGEYTVERDYIMLTDKEQDSNDPTYYTGTKYYYINTQRLGIPSEGNWGLPTELRNAVYVAENEIDTYYNWYSDIVTNADPEYWTGVFPLSKDDFIAQYASYPYRKLSGSEHYTFMGWYQVHDNGSVDSMPYNFNDPAVGPLELRALWRLDGGYYVQYHPSYHAEDGTDVTGQLEQGTDPVYPSQMLYADQAPTHILHAPTNITSGWVFRGWRVVKANGTNWEPIQFDDNGNPVYYQPGDSFTIDSELVSEEDGTGAIIHIQAYYEREDATYRKPYVTNLILDANDLYGGYINTNDSSSLPPLTGPGSTAINTTTELFDGHPTQILFGDIQSNLALHLYRYATTDEHHEVVGTKYFENTDGFMLIGFDEKYDPYNPTTGKAFIPAFATDSVASVTRNETNRILYAMWEPMVYVTFVNTTDKDITISLSGTGTDTVSVINMVTGEFDREQTTSTITVPAKTEDGNGMVKVVLPQAAAGTDSLTATATNDHLRKKISVSGEYPKGTAYGVGSTDVTYGDPVTYTGTLVNDKDGIVVTYTEEPDVEVIYDVNSGTWTDNDPYYKVSGDIYAIDGSNIESHGGYEPSDPTRSGKIFIGWTTNADIAAHTDFSSESAVTWGETTITPDADGIVLDKVKSDYLWDFSQEPPYDQTLYAVWSDAVTVTFNIAYSSNMSANPIKLHTWNGPDVTDVDEPYVFYQSDSTSPYVTYTLAKGDRVLKPVDPSAHSDRPTWNFIKWLIGNSTTDSYRYNAKVPSDGDLTTYAYDFSGRVTSDVNLVTSWTENQSQTFTFTVENHVEGGSADEEFDYTISVIDELVLGKLGDSNRNSVGPPDRKWGTVNTSLKNNQQYTINITVSYISNWGGANSVEISVLDRDGIEIKNGHVIYCNKNTYKNFVSDYKYTLKITQEEKSNYRTTVDIEDNIGNIIANTDNASRSFTFESSESRTASAVSSFTPEVNAYAGGELNSLTVIFTNVGELVAPTGIYNDKKPFSLMMLLGGALALLAMLPVFKRQRRDDDDPGGGRSRSGTGKPSEAKGPPGEVPVDPPDLKGRARP